MERPWEVDEPNKPKDSHREFITEIDCQNLSEYYLHIAGLKRDKFVRHENLIDLNQASRKKLQDLVNDGYEIVTVTHFDADAKRDGKVEVYKKQYQG